MSSGYNDDAATTAWAGLPRDLCNEILDRADAISVVHFPAVCTSWAAGSNTDICRPHMPSGIPMLLTSSVDPEGGYEFEYNLEPGSFGLHDITTSKSYHGEVDRLKNRTWIGGKDDWLVTTDLRCDIELFNPITGANVFLPSFATMLGVEVVEVSQYDPGVCFDDSPYAFQPNSLFRWTTHHLKKMALCQKPTHPKGFLVVAIFSGDRTSTVAFTADSDDKQWTLLRNPEGENRCYVDLYIDVIVQKGKVLAVATSGNLCSWDIDGDTVSEPTILSPPENGIYIHNYDMHVFYLATSTDGDLQLVSMLGNRNNGKGRASGLDSFNWVSFNWEWSFWPRLVLLHELDAVTGIWRRISSLGGGHSLFVGINYPFYAHVPRNGSGDPLLQEDCVYIADLIDCQAGFFDLRLGDEFDIETAN